LATSEQFLPLISIHSSTICRGVVLYYGSAALPCGKLDALAKQVNRSNGGLSEELNEQA